MKLLVERGSGEAMSVYKNKGASPGKAWRDLGWQSSLQFTVTSANVVT